MLKIYNTLSRELEEFTPLQKDLITFYQCGPTVYSHQHIGNLFSPTKGDLIRRSLEYLGWQVRYVRNITDVGHLVSDEDNGEDKMEKGAKREGLTPEEIAKKYTQLYHEDLKKLNVKDPDQETIATEYIKQMADMVQILIDKGFAYATELAIYFDISKFPEYTKLSRQKLEENRERAGHGNVDDPGKRNSFDFAVWFFKAGSHKNAIQSWEYKFAGIEQNEVQGFPGWHIECSAMAKDALGITIDLHMGGREHIPVHHTNEIAQSEAANGVKFVNYWLHHEMLVIEGAKMSKSKGNIYTLDDLIIKGFSALDFRYFLLQAHYRSQQNFTWQALEAARVAHQKLRSEVAKLQAEVQKSASVDKQAQDEFRKALEADFGIPQALAVLWNLIKSEQPAGIKLKTIIDFDRVLGLNLNQVSKIELSAEVYQLLEQRKIARINKDWGESDRLRDLLRDKYAVIVEDVNSEQQVRVLA